METFPPIHFSFIDRLTSAAKMGTSASGNAQLKPTQVNGSNYQSPYTLHFSFSWDDLVVGFDQDPFNQYTKEGLPDNGSYGPVPRPYPRITPPASASNRLARWQAERLIALAASMVGYRYEYHHVPDWNPTPDPNGSVQGVDCTNYTSWLYNYALGIPLNSATPEQGRFLIDPIFDHGQVNSQGQIANRQEYKVRRVATAQTPYAQLSSLLQPGDLLFIAGDKSKDQIKQDTASMGPGDVYPAITHVVMWVGDIGLSPKGLPLITDSHGNELIDDNGSTIPGGVQIRPFHDADYPTSQNAPEWVKQGDVLKGVQGWYFDHFVWALRILPDITPA